MPYRTYPILNRWKKVASKYVVKRVKRRVFDGEAFYSMVLERHHLPETKEKIRDSILENWRSRADQNLRSNRRYRRAKAKSSTEPVTTPMGVDCPELLADERIRKYADQLRAVPSNSFLRRLNQAHISSGDREFYSCRLPPRRVFLHEHGRFYSDWTSMENAKNRTRTEIFAGDIDVDIRHAHFSIFESLVRQYSVLAGKWDRELGGKDVYDYFSEHGIGKAAAKGLLNPLIYGVQRDTLNELRREYRVTVPNPPLFYLIGSARWSLMSREVIKSDALGRPMKFWHPGYESNYEHNKEMFTRLLCSYELLCKAHIFSDLWGGTVLSDYHDGCIVSLRDIRRYDEFKERLAKKADECKELFGMNLDLKIEMIWFEERLVMW